MAQQHQVEVSSPVLDAFLRITQPRLLVGKELEDRLHAAMERPATATRPPTELLPHRIMACWRLSRATAQATGLCAEDEPLEGATELDPSPWQQPYMPRVAPNEQRYIRGRAATALHKLYKKVGLPLLPPRQDTDAVERWCLAMTIVADAIGLARTLENVQSLDCLLNPRMAPHSGVTEQHVLALEELLIDEAQKLIIEVGERPAVEHFRTRYYFSRKEAIGLVRLARADALATGSASVEEDRAIMVANLKDLVARAKEEMNTDRELRALKELARVQGLTRSEPEDMARSFMSVIAQVGRAQDQKTIDVEARVVPALPPHSEYEPLDDQETDGDEDPELLAEYDREARQ